VCDVLSAANHVARIAGRPPRRGPAIPADGVLSADHLLHPLPGGEARADRVDPDVVRSELGSERADYRPSGRRGANSYCQSDACKLLIHLAYIALRTSLTALVR
jgi:hypothetical protein